MVNEPVAHIDESASTALNRMLRYRFTVLPVVDHEAGTWAQ